MSTWIHFEPEWLAGHELVPELQYTAVVRNSWRRNGRYSVAQADEAAEVLRLLRGMLETARVREMQEYGEYDVEGWIFYTRHCLEGGMFLGNDVHPCIHRLWYEVQRYESIADDAFAELLINLDGKGQKNG